MRIGAILIPKVPNVINIKKMQKRGLGLEEIRKKGKREAWKRKKKKESKEEREKDRNSCYK